MPHVHETHPKIIQRLKRAEGHLRKTIAMIEEERPCLDLAQQLYAVEKAISSAKETLIRDHLDHCLEHAIEKGKDSKNAMNDFKEITKYL